MGLGLSFGDGLCLEEGEGLELDGGFEGEGFCGAFSRLLPDSR